MPKYLLKGEFQLAQADGDIVYDETRKGWQMDIGGVPNLFVDVDKNTYTVSDMPGTPIPVPTREELEASMPKPPPIPTTPPPMTA